MVQRGCQLVLVLQERQVLRVLLERLVPPERQVRLVPLERLVLREPRVLLERQDLKDLQGHRALQVQ